MHLNLQISLHESIMGSEKVGKIMNANSELKKQLKEAKLDILSFPGIIVKERERK